MRDEVGFEHPWALGDAGDFYANELLLRRLRAERPGDAVLSEEAHDDLVRLTSERVWIIDPVDGTREFSTPGRDDWAVHIALWQRPTDGQHRRRTRDHRRRSGFASARKHRLPQRHRDRTGRDPRRAPTAADRRERQPAAMGPAPDAPDTAHPTRGDRLGGRQSDGDHRRRRRTPTCTPAASGNGIQPRPPGWSWPPACTRRGLTAHRCATTRPTRICLTS